MTKTYKYKVEKNCDHTFYYTIESNIPLTDDDIDDCVGDVDTKEWDTTLKYKGITTTYDSDIRENVNFKTKEVQ